MRVFVFGVDGLTFRILDPLIERGLLPNFQRVRDGGVQGVLKSTTPPLTPPAWMSISTGLAPAKHGVYDFREYEQTEQGPQASLVTHRKGGKAIWNILSEYGKRVIIANVPLTYPPEAVNGIMLSGYMAPDIRANVTYPASFKEELLEAVPDYQIDLKPSVASEHVGDLLSETLKMTQARIAMLRLLLNKPWDFFFIAFTGADRIQHFRWDEIMKFHPQAVAYYQMIDEALGMALASLDAEDVLMVVSDHGFQGINRAFYLQKYLYKLGLLNLRDTGVHYRAELLEHVKDRLRQLVWALGLRGVPSLIRHQLRQLKVLPVSEDYHLARLPDLDWANTHAWIRSKSGELAGYADIILDDSMTAERIDELIAALQKIRDPETGQPLIVEIHREDAFGDGPFATQERHLVVLSGEHMTLRTDLAANTLWKTCPPSGIHHSDGVLYLYGAGVKKGQTIASTHVYDVVPTILSYMEVPLPHELDGRMMADAFEQVPHTDIGSKGNSTVMRKLMKLAAQVTEKQ